jgi:hypothetical protein
MADLRRGMRRIGLALLLIEPTFSVRANDLHLARIYHQVAAPHSTARLEPAW